jgi:D-alanyl-D-alanine carboxypeptidase (penicillin-binding protein 5/6)
MTVTVNQKISLAIVHLAMKFLWYLDVVTNISPKIASKLFRYALVFFIVISLGVFVYSYKYINDFFLGFVYTVNGYPSNNLAQLKLKPAEYPVVISNVRVPYISAKSVLVVDKSNSKVLFEINPEVSLAPASTTKLMTALIALELYSPDEEVSISTECAAVDSTKAYLSEGSKYKVRDLISAMLVSSAGDAACALGSGKLPTEEFVSLMNSKAKQLGLLNTHFSNAIGLDGNGSHRSTAVDLYQLSVAAMEYPLIRDAVHLKNYDIRSTDSQYLASVSNTNRLLWEVEGTLGIKTGTTAEAGEVLIYENSDGKKDIVIVVMSSQDRFGDTTKLLDWVNQKYRW